ncbi:conserved domain protein [Bacteroides clarus YIT 12056]|uniref:Conserved domain protein n=1 Tax=Bacteroides clarus YIT 12056 TaxID=762984 RepID=A0ABP2KUA9_9BACE|nr:conserved domain protein [Bacteroides clarus YIT 12056]
MQQAFHPVAAVGVYHLAVFGHDDVRGFITILSHVVAAQVERGTGQRILGEGDIAEYVLALRGPGEYLAVAYGLVLAVVQFQTVEIVVAAERLAVHHAPEVQIHALVGIGGDIAAVVGQEEAEAGVEVLVTVGCTAGCHVVGLFDEMFGGVGYLVVVDVYLRTGEDVAFSQTEQEPRVDLYAAVTVFAGTVAADIILVGTVTDAVEVVFRILVDELSEDTETVAFKEKLRLYHQIDAAFKHIGYGHGQHRTQLCGIAGVHAESHQRASAYQRAEIGRIAGTA